MITIYNTLTGTKEEFKPIKKGAVGIYNCGPTVYDTSHIGNFRSMVMYDIIRRVFEYESYFVTQVMNITDVDDKTIRRSQREKKSLAEVTRHYETIFLTELQSLNILTPHRILRATDHIKEMIEMISVLLEKGIAIKCNDYTTLAYKVDMLLADPDRLLRMHRQALAWAKPGAAELIAQTLLDEDLPSQRAVELGKIPNQWWHGWLKW